MTKEKTPTGAAKLSQIVAEIEGKNKSLSIAQIKEVVGIISDIAYQFGGIDAVLVANGKRRASKK